MFPQLNKTSRLVGAAVVAGVIASAALVGLSKTAGATTAAAPANTSLPTISGTAQQSQTLKADPGTWSGSTPINFSYQWRRCNVAGGVCKNISGATNSTYVLVAADVGHRLRVAVTATNSSGSVTEHSRPTDVVQRPQAPRNTTEPSISGAAQVGQTLTANPGTWSGTQPIQLSYEWRRCNTAAAACVVTGVTTQTYLVGSADVGHRLRIHVTARNTVGRGTALSNATSVVTSGGPPAGQCESITRVSLPNRLVVDRITYSPPTIHSRAVPLVARFHVVDTRGVCVSGALVLGLGVPFNRLSAPPEVTTDATGWAQISFQVLPTFQLRPGNLVVIFVRARKPGENVLAGVSTRRLVSVRVS